ncbi:MAG: DUF134 domain-containing protein [Thermoplasmata archaeon]|nr:DUF134 domain-containing protein [Thermoplasmata archaeon]
MMPWRGRRRGPRWISINPNVIMFGPIGRQPEGKIFLYVSELEALKLVDVENLTQEEAAQKLGISRKTLWTDLTKARAKIITAIINGYVIEIIPDFKDKE